MNVKLSCWVKSNLDMSVFYIYSIYACTELLFCWYGFTFSNLNHAIDNRIESESVLPINTQTVTKAKS